MLEDQVAYLLQRYLGNYVRGLNKEALKISVWQGDVELTNMQLKPEALNALKLPVQVKAGFLGSVKLKVPWSRLGQDPVLVYLDRIFILAEPATQVEGCTEDGIQEAKKRQVRELEMKLLERAQQLKLEMSNSWLGSLINTVVGNLKLSISNIHIRYEDLESNPGHPFAAGVTLEKLSAVTIDDSGKETFVTSGSLDRIHKSVELDQLALYLDNNISPWYMKKPWEDLLPSEWVQVFRFGTENGKPADQLTKKHSYILQPVTGNAKYSKERSNGSANSVQPLQKAAVNLDDVTLCLSKDGYGNFIKLAENFASFNQRLKFAHHRPLDSLKSSPRSWWRYAYRVVSDQLKKESGKLSWEQVLKYTSLRKRYISLYASLLKSDLNRVVVDDNKEIEDLDRELDIDLILQWRMLAHKFVEKSVESDHYRKQNSKKSWWSFGWNSKSFKDENEPFRLSEEDWEQLNKIIGYKEEEEGSLIISDRADHLHTSLEIHMKHNASKLIDEGQVCLAELSCEDLDCSIKLYPETKVFNMTLGSYRLSSPNGPLAESATAYDSLVGVFCYKPFDAKVDWKMAAKASPCYMTYLKDSIDQIINFFESDTAVSQTIALEAAAAVQMTIDGVKRTAQQQVNQALKDHTRFLLDLDIAAPKITIPTGFRPDNIHSTKLLLDLGNLVIRSQDEKKQGLSAEMDMYLQFDLVLSDISAFLVDGDYHWGEPSSNESSGSPRVRDVRFLPVIDKCGVILKLQQIRLENPSYPSTRISVRLPSLGFHFSPARYHRLMQIAKMFKDYENPNSRRPWNQADFEGWSSLLTWKGVGNREAVWQQRYLCLVGPFLYILESPDAMSYKQYISLRGKQIYQVPPEFAGGVEHVLAVCDAARSNSKVVEDVNSLVLRCGSDDIRKTWRRRLQGAIYRASVSAPITGLSETSSDSETELNESHDIVDLSRMESLFMTGVLDELKLCFSYNKLHEHSFTSVLLAEESNLIEFRAIGGQVELSIRANDMFIGTVLKSLEVEDLFCCHRVSRPCYLARSFIGNSDVGLSFYDAGNQSFDDRDIATTTEGDDKFYEAPEDLVEFLELKTPSFNRIANLLPGDALHYKTEDGELSRTLDSFVKAQIVTCDQNSPQYNNVDMQIAVTLATLSFFCRRPTILAILEFVNAITIEDDSCEAFSDDSSAVSLRHEASEDADGQHLTTNEEPVVKGLLGKGKSRIIFNLTLNMDRAEILLMNEDDTKLATLSQDNLLTDIKVFPSSFSIKAALGNLKISDDSLPSSHLYFGICDMRNPGGSSFIELVFSSYNADDDDYKGYEYSLYGQLSEVRIVYLNRFLQEVVGYFMGLVPENSKGFVKIKDQVTNSEKLFTTSEIEGSPAIKLDLSLRKPIILMPRRTDSLDYLKLDIVHITVQNTFQWFCGSKNDINAVHLEVLTILIEDINLNVGNGTEIGESIIQGVRGVSVVVQRSLRDLLHKIPSTEAAIQIEELKAVLSNREYQIITECAVSNFSETPRTVPPVNHVTSASSVDMIEPVSPQDSVGVEPEILNAETWIALKVSVVINLVELCLHTGVARDVSLATIQASGAWLLYKSDNLGGGILSATLKGFSVIDDREGTEQKYRLAVGKPDNIGYSYLRSMSGDNNKGNIDAIGIKENDDKSFPTMLILDAKFSQMSTFISLCVQRPQLLVALDFLLAVVEFFVPTVGSMLSNEEDKSSSYINDAIILDHSTYCPPSSEISLSPDKPLIVDDERFDHFVYDGKGGVLCLKDRQGLTLSAPSAEAIIFVGNGKRLQLKNVTVKNGKYLDSCILLGTNSSYSASKDDQVYFKDDDDDSRLNSGREIINDFPSQNTAVDTSTEFIIELQAIGPELTFYNTSKDISESPILSNRLLHAELDVFSRLTLKGDEVEMSANALGFTMESNGITILEPFDTSIKYSNASGKTTIHLSVSDIFMNFSFSILQLFLAVEDDILAFLRMTSKKMTVVCSQFDKVGVIKNTYSDQVYAFWRPRAPPGFAFLGDYLTPLDKPPTKGVIAVNTNFARVKRPISFKLIWPRLNSGSISDSLGKGILSESDSQYSIWLPEAPKGYVTLGCVVSRGLTQPPLSAAYCILASLVSPCSLRDCITISLMNVHPSSLAFWRVDNSVGTFLPADPSSLSLTSKAYDLRHVVFGFTEGSQKSPRGSNAPISSPGRVNKFESERSAAVNSGRRFEAVASFRLVWWNQGSNSRKKLSIWRPVVPQGMVYFGDIVVAGYETPNTCIVLHDTDQELLRAPLDFQLVGQIQKQRGMENISFWMPQAPPGFVSLGCVASKGMPKQNDFSTLRCMRSDMVSGDQFLEESIWSSSDAKIRTEPFSIWMIGNELGTFIVRSGFKKPPRRFALKLSDPNVPSCSNGTVIDAKIRTFSVALFDDYGGLMVPLFNISLSGVGFHLHGKTDYLNSTTSFSLAARSYNDKNECWEPLVEPVDGFLRYQYDLNAPGAASQLRLTSTKDLNLNVSVSNVNMIIQAYASWSNLSHVHDYYKNKEASAPTYGETSVVHYKKHYFIIPQNKLGQDIFFRATEIKGLPNIIRMPSGDMKPLKVPVSKNMLDSHLEGKLCQKIRRMVTVVIADAQFPKMEGLTSHQYSVAIRLILEQSLPSEPRPHQQSARTCGTISEQCSSPEFELVKWNEIFFFKVDSLDNYIMELRVTDVGRGGLVGYFSAPLKKLTGNIHDSLYPEDFVNELTWIDLTSAEHMNMVQEDTLKKSQGRIRCAVVISPRSEIVNSQKYLGEKKSGVIQISPSREGPWTTVRLNYAAPAACWRLGNNVVASEVMVKDGNRYVNIRSLASVRNNTDLVLDVCLTSTASSTNTRILNDASKPDSLQVDGNRVQTDEFFETEKYGPSIGWVGCGVQPSQEVPQGEAYHQVELPSGWEWIDNWNLDTGSIETVDGWVYAPNVESLNWPASIGPSKFVNCARQRRWVRNRKHILGDMNEDIYVGQLKPGETLPLPLSGFTQSGQYVFKLRPFGSNDLEQYSWSSVVDKPDQLEVSSKQRGCSEIHVSSLKESEELLCCTEIIGCSSDCLRKLWFCVSIQATEIAKDIHSDPIHDWSLVVKPPLSISNLLPLAAEYAVLEMQASGSFVDCSRGMFLPGNSVEVYNADIRNSLFFSLLPQRGWQPVDEAVLVSDPLGVPSKTVSLRSLVSERIVQIILEQNYDTEQPLSAKTIRVYAPYWFSVARCPPLTFRLLGMSEKKRSRKIPLPFQSKKNSEEILEEISEEEIYDGYSIASALNFNLLGLSASISQSVVKQFGPVADLSPLGDMDGSLDLFAYDTDGNCMRLFISTKPCPYQSVPTKVIAIRPFMTFTNRCGEDIYIKLSGGDEPKVLRPSDSRVSFACHELGETNKLQVRLEDTKWSFPIQILKEDTVSLVLRTHADTHADTRRFLRMEIRGYEEGSRFVIVFRIGNSNGPIRIENRTTGKTISIRQFGFSEDTCILLQPLSTKNFCWEDPYGQKFIHARIDGENSSGDRKLDLGKTGLCSVENLELDLQFHVVQMGDVKVARFYDHTRSNSNQENSSLSLVGNWGNTCMPIEIQNNATPMELMVEMGVIGVSVVDHSPKEVSYIYLEHVLISYSTGYDGGTTSRFKLRLGYLQLDNQLPLTLMPVLLAPEQTSNVHRPVFKMTITMCNENADGVLIYPYVYIRVTDKCWRINIHEPIIWAFVEFYNKLQLDRVPQSSSITEVDPEIRVDLIDVSEVRLKVAMETAPAQRPHGVLGVWSPILSAVGNAFKIQVHLRRVMHRDRFMRKSSIAPSIGNRIWRDLIHNPLHLIFSVDVLGMASSTLSSLSKGFAEISTDGQFLQLRSKQVWSRKVTGVGDGIVQGTEALAQGFAFGLSGVLTKPVDSARQNGLFGFAQGLGQAVLGFVVQPVSGALDFFSLTVDGIGASCSKCLEVFNNKTTAQRIRNPRAIRVDGILREYCEEEAVGQMILYLAEASRHFGCTEIFKEPSKFALSDYYEEHFVVPYKRVVLVTSRRVMLLQCLAPDKMDKKPCKIMWDVPWEELMAVELAKASSSRPSHLMLHLKKFTRSEKCIRVIKCNVEEVEGRETQAARICSVVHKMWKSYQSDMKCLALKVPSSQRHVHFAWSESYRKESHNRSIAIVNSRELSSVSAVSDERRFVKHTINFVRIWSSEQEVKRRCSLARKQVLQESGKCTIWRPVCPEGYVSIGDVAHVGYHPPNVAAVYLNTSRHFTLPMGYDLVWRNCLDDYTSPVSIWHPRAPEGYVSVGCIAVNSFTEPELDAVYCVAESVAEETAFEQKVWSAPEAYPWACHIYQVQSDALHFVALRQLEDQSDWKPMRVLDDQHLHLLESSSSSSSS